MCKLFIVKIIMGIRMPFFTWIIIILSLDDDDVGFLVLQFTIDVSFFIFGSSLLSIISKIKILLEFFINYLLIINLYLSFKKLKNQEQDIQVY